MTPSDSHEQKRGAGSILIIGAGPAGLAAGYALAKRGRAVRILEADPEYVGGISRTVSYQGYHFDIGGHRFFSKSREVEEFWTEILPDDLLTRPRSSRIYYNHKFFAYPLRPVEAFAKLGALESARCVLSYFRARVSPIRPAVSFEDWVVNRFGRRLFDIFFKTYTEKVWGMSCKEISADWAAQRIKGLSLWSALRNAIRRPGAAVTAKTLINSFRYPRLGPGMLWQACAGKVRAMGGEVLLGQRMTGCAYDEGAELWTVRTAGGEFTARHVISSAPLGALVEALEPGASEAALRAARGLRYRDFLTVAVMLRDRGKIGDNWIYIHDPSVRVGRIQNFKSWSPAMVPDPSMACYGLEYFCFEGDGLWNSPDAELIALAVKELCQIGLAEPADITDGRVVRQQKAYPVYDAGYLEHVGVIRRELEARYPRLWPVGRNGMHKYNNQDHANMTGMLAAENVMAERALYDLWRVNEDAEYHEEGSSGLRMVPERIGRE